MAEDVSTKCGNNNDESIDNNLRLVYSDFLKIDNVYIIPNNNGYIGVATQEDIENGKIDFRYRMVLDKAYNNILLAKKVNYDEYECINTLDGLLYPLGVVSVDKRVGKIIPRHTVEEFNNASGIVGSTGMTVSYNVFCAANRFIALTSNNKMMTNFTDLYDYKSSWLFQKEKWPSQLIYNSKQIGDYLLLSGAEINGKDTHLGFSLLDKGNGFRLVSLKDSKAVLTCKNIKRKIKCDLDKGAIYIWNNPFKLVYIEHNFKVKILTGLKAFNIVCGGKIK